MSEKKAPAGGLSLVDDRSPEQREQELRTIEETSGLLRSGLQSAGLSPTDNEVLLALALGADIEPANEQEAAGAAELRRMLDNRDWPQKASFAAALRAAERAGEASAGLGAERHELLLRSACGAIETAAAHHTAAHHGVSSRERAELLELGQAVGAASAPRALDPEDHALLLALALGTDAHADAELPRLDAGAEERDLTELSESIRAATGGAALDELALQRAIAKAVDAAGRKPSGRSYSRWYLQLAAAAGFALLLVGLSQFLPGGAPQASGIAAVEKAPRVPAKLVSVRSTAALVQESQPFALRGGESARLRLIVRARAADLRRNRYARWGLP